MLLNIICADKHHLKINLEKCYENVIINFVRNLLIQFMRAVKNLKAKLREWRLLQKGVHRRQQVRTFLTFGESRKFLSVFTNALLYPPS